MSRPSNIKLRISIGEQRLQLFEGDQVLRDYRVSTSKYGPGEEKNSWKTPRGKHVISDMIGGDQPINSVFKARQPTGEIYSPELGAANPDRDWILSRILWLSGCEDGVNCGGNVDTHDRYVYIHGCPDSAPMGEPGSIGCIRMRNADVIELYDLVSVDTPVLIEE